MLQLGFGRGQRHRQLAEYLGVRVQGVAGVTPGRIGDRRPCWGHAATVLMYADQRLSRLRSRDNGA